MNARYQLDMFQTINSIAIDGIFKLSVKSHHTKIGALLLAKSITKMAALGFSWLNTFYRTPGTIQH